MASSLGSRVSRSKAMRFDPSAVITIRVGKGADQKDFVAHEGLLTARSEFFRRAMNGNWEESRARVVNLTEDEPRIFGIYLNYIYTSELATVVTVATEDNSLKPIEDPKAEWRSRCCKEYEDLAWVYVLSEKLQDTQAKNSTVAAILAVANQINPSDQWQRPHAKAIAIIYDSTPDSSPARRLFSDLWSNVSLANISANFFILPKEFLWDLTIKLLKDRPAHMNNTAKALGPSAYLEKPKDTGDSHPRTPSSSL